VAASYHYPAEAAGLARPRAPLSFRAEDKLRRSGEFLRLQRTGIRYQTAHFVFFAASPFKKDGLKDLAVPDEGGPNLG